MDITVDVVKDEQKMLRSELQQLKNCQLQYFTFSVTGTAAIFGFASQKFVEWLLGFSFLVPLTIILPCWWIFFDKATTITRIVGYYRVLERILNCYPNCKVNHIGYESALAFYRIEDDGDGRKKMNESPRCKKLKSELYGTTKTKNIRHRYWLLNWYTYLVLSVICCTMSFITIYNIIGFHYLLFILLLAFAFVLLTAFKTLTILKNITSGDYSYNENYIFWEYILENNPYNKNRKMANLPENAGKPWDQKEIDQLIKEYDSGIKINELSKSHKRTKGAIEGRLVKIGKISGTRFNY